jgi:hypothetical protein
MSFVFPLRQRDLRLKKLVIGIDLYFDEVRWLDAFFDFSEVDALRHE